MDVHPWFMIEQMVILGKDAYRLVRMPNFRGCWNGKDFRNIQYVYKMLNLSCCSTTFTFRKLVNIMFMNSTLAKYCKSKKNYYNYGPQKVDNFTKSRRRSARQILQWTSHVILSLWKLYNEKWQWCILCSNAPIQGLNIVSQNCCHMATMGTDVIKITYCDSP